MFFLLEQTAVERKRLKPSPLFTSRPSFFFPFFRLNVFEIFSSSNLLPEKKEDKCVSSEFTGMKSNSCECEENNLLSLSP